MKSWLCAIGLHKWHKHTARGPFYRAKAFNGGSWRVYDLVCLRCRLEKNKASKKYEADKNKAALVREVESELK